jgi:hypothetical protein
MKPKQGRCTSEMRAAVYSSPAQLACDVHSRELFGEGGIKEAPKLLSPLVFLSSSSHYKHPPALFSALTCSSISSSASPTSVSDHLWPSPSPVPFNKSSLPKPTSTCDPRKPPWKCSISRYCKLAFILRPWDISYTSPKGMAVH